MSSICDDRGQELVYAGMPITDVILLLYCLLKRTKSLYFIDNFYSKTKLKLF
jgi:hypothetical protein